LALKANTWACVASQRIGVKRPRQDETITWKPSTGVGIAAEIRGDQKRRKPKTPPRRGRGWMQASSRSPEGKGKDFFLDILFHRMSEIALVSTLGGNAVMTEED